LAESPSSSGDTPAPRLTPGQAAAADAFASWLAAPWDGTPFVLSGYAGTGKTFLCRQLLQQVEASGLCWTVVAPTHKAVGVLRQQLAWAGLQPTWYPSTIHRLLRLKLRRQGDLERCEETDQTATALENLGLVLVDEASMVDSTLLEISLRCAHPFRTRLVFVGDPAQLPPVGESESPVFAMGRAASACLTEVVRHQGPVLQLATGLRNGQLPCRQPPPLAAIRDDHGQVVALPRQQWLEAAQAGLRRAAELDNPDHARILCYTNRALEQLVPLARRAIHGDMADQLPVLPGEVLITRLAVMAPACRAGEEAAEEPDLLLGSNRELVVRDVTPERCDLAEFGVGAGDGLTAPVIQTLNAEVDTGETRLSLRLLPPVGGSDRAALDGVLQRLRQQAREAGKQGGRNLWRRYFLVRDAFASLGPAAVLTVHRSQGSTFGEVYVAGDVFWPQDAVLRRQLVYVAVSRASEAVWLMAGGSTTTAAERDSDRRLWHDWLHRGGEPLS
jgi:exodeoxyribonuclease V